ncbi:MAG: alpha-amylase [Pseudopedobacter saltans]|uniref:Alpha-amylase n=1 Tax=Pseudopedobacter saltans TaxID=151895 RepID=A0A2W5EWY0_9SPHI|nr:MAG: alpha-amylase [Pseudopedobacter saltans]
MKLTRSLMYFVLWSSFFNITSLHAQDTKIDRIEPLNWWVDMKYDTVQLIIHGKNISLYSPSIEYKNIKILQVHKVENPNYLFVDLYITPSAKAGKFPIIFSQKGKSSISYSYELKERNKSVKAQGVTSKDFIYLLMPDRFSNGDASNDKVAGLLDQSLSRDTLTSRHGGDMQGVIKHLDYLQELGITSLWMTPVLENDQSETSYHGYANTENYHIDPRYGSNELFKILTDSLHGRGMKMVMDVVPNHFGSQHWTVVDMPMKDWVHQWPSYTNSNFRDQVDFDPYGAESDRKQMVNGWFDKHMPDMNESNPYLQKYILQSNLWWIEYAGVDGFRIDTYPYNDPVFMANWAKAILKEYPGFTMFGETFVRGAVNQAAFAEGDMLHRGIDTHLQGVTDFQSLWAITDAMTKPFSWDDGVMKIYNNLSKDFIYKDPTRNVVFLDNHDLSRFYSVVGQNQDKLKSALAWMLTTRGIPQLYYGTEILMKGFSNPDGYVREDFPGGWAGDKDNKFSEKGRSQSENELYNYIATLANYRKKNRVLQDGKLMQYVPQDGVYVYFRYNDSKTIMIVMNTNDKAFSLDTKRFEQRLSNYTSAVNILDNTEVKNIRNIKIPSYTTLVLELK